MATEVYTTLAELSREEELLSQKVETLLSDAGKLTRSLQKLDLLRAQSQSIQVGSSLLLSTLERTSTTAERISFNVRALDAEQSRVKETLKYVEEIKELKACVLGVHQSMEAQEWEVAAEQVHRASLVPEQIARGKFAAMMVPTAETPLSPKETIDEASEKLFVLFTREFKAATNSRDTRQITRFFKLFPQIDRAKEGLELYVDFVSGFIAERAERALNTASDSPVLYASLMTGLFENIAKLISNHTPLITRFYGNNIDGALARIQTECDRQGLLIMTTMEEDRQIKKKVSEIKSYSFSFLVQSFLPSVKDNFQAPEEREVDSKTLDVLLTEISIIFSRWTLYTTFMQQASTARGPPAFLAESALSTFLTSKLEGQYETMEAYFMRRSVERAFQLEKLESSDTGFEVSSVVDDVMFILRKVTLRALSSGQLRTVSAIFAVVRRILEQDYAGVLGRRMQDLQNRIAVPKTGVVVRAVESETRDRDSYCHLLNSLDVSADHVSRIVEEHSKSSSLESFRGDDNDEHGEKDAALHVVQVLNLLKDRFSRGLEDGINVLYNTTIKHRVRVVVNETFVRQSYLLAATIPVGQAIEEDSRGGSSNDAFRSTFTRAWRELIAGPFEAVLTPHAYLLLLKVTVRAFIRVLEKKLLTLKCDELGAIQLDRDVACIVNTASGTYPGVRERFDRVREMCLVVNWRSEDDDDNDNDHENAGGRAVANRSGGGEGEEIIRSLGLQKVGVEEVEMIRQEMLVE